MIVTILEALENADYNLRENRKTLGEIAIKLAEGQLHNAVELLLKGYSLDDEVEPLINEHGTVENVPEKAE